MTRITTFSLLLAGAISLSFTILSQENESISPLALFDAINKCVTTNSLHHKDYAKCRVYFELGKEFYEKSTQYFEKIAQENRPLSHNEKAECEFCIKFTESLSKLDEKLNIPPQG